MRDIGSLGESTVASGINNRGQIVGESNMRAFLWERGRMRDLGTLGGEFGSASGINDRGQVAGSSNPFQDNVHGFLWTPGATDGVPSNPEMKDLGSYGGSPTFAYGLNRDGLVAGDANVNGGFFQAVVWQGGQLIQLGTFGGYTSGARGMNERGEVTGWATTSANMSRAFLWKDGQLLDLGALPNGLTSSGLRSTAAAWWLGIAGPRSANPMP